MKRRVFSLLLVLVLMLAALPVTASATPAQNIAVYAPVYNSTGALTSISTEFDWGWGYASVNRAFLALSSKYLNGSNPGNSGWGDFSDFGDIDDNYNFQTIADVKAHNANEYQLISTSSETKLTQGQNKTITFDLSTSPIAPVEGCKYYVYLWVYYNNNYFPDNLISVIQFKDGKWTYTPGIPGDDDYRNHYDPSASAFKEVTQESPNQTPTQPTQPTQPSQPTQHVCDYTPWASNATNHWRFCKAANHANSQTRNLTMVDNGPHVYTDDHDPECNVCGYTRTITDERPATGDITNIPLWTMFFFAGVALMYVQLTQRKREQF